MRFKIQHVCNTKSWSTCFTAFLSKLWWHWDCFHPCFHHHIFNSRAFKRFCCEIFSVRKMLSSRLNQDSLIIWFRVPLFLMFLKRLKRLVDNRDTWDVSILAEDFRCQSYNWGDKPSKGTCCLYQPWIDTMSHESLRFLEGRTHNTACWCLKHKSCCVVI